jgi:hypothetical protein
VHKEWHHQQRQRPDELIHILVSNHRKRGRVWEVVVVLVVGPSDIKPVSKVVVEKLIEVAPSVLCCVTSSVVAEFMVRITKQPVPAARTFSVRTQFTMSTGKRSGHTRGMPLDHTHARASSEQAWEPMLSASADFCRKTRTVPRPEYEEHHDVVAVPVPVLAGDRMHG